MLFSFLRVPALCAHCLEPISGPRALCADCLLHLVPAPVLCPCGSLCAGPCDRPWVETPVATFHSLYLLTGPTFGILKRWKWHGGSWLTESLLNAQTPSIRQSFADRGLAAIVPVPQTWARSFELGRNPAEEIGRALGKILGLPTVPGLQIVANTARQSSLDHEERLTRSGNRFQPGRRRVPKNGGLLLVDDFHTTGATLRQAARCLRERHGGPIHCFTLGYRPRLESTEVSARYPAA